MTMARFFLIFFGFYSVWKASVVCEGQSALGNAFKAEISETLEKDFSNVLRVSIEIRDSDGIVLYQNHFDQLSHVWDGHMTGLITSPLLSIKYEDHYGCIRNASIVTNTRDPIKYGIMFIEEISIDLCSGGTTSDELCLGN